MFPQAQEQTSFASFLQKRRLFLKAVVVIGLSSDRYLSKHVRVFFSEEKNQKTFGSAPLPRLGLLYGGR